MKIPENRYLSVEHLNSNKPLVAEHEVLHCLQQFHPKSDIFEIRIIKAHNRQGKHLGTLSGYFDSPYKATQAILRANVIGNTYHTINPLKYDILARSINKLTPWTQHTTNDNDVFDIRWLPIDIDYIRQSGMSATYNELLYTNEVRHKVQKYCNTGNSGFHHGAMSGNGCYVMIKIQKPIDSIKDVLEHLAEKFNTDQVAIDTGIYNPARIMKVYGTVAQKGDHTPLYNNWTGSHRPWRYSYMLEVGNQYG